jgi:hypothetical protein
MWSRVFSLLLLSTLAAAQQTSSTPAAVAVSGVDNDFIHQQFSSSCSLDPKFSPFGADLNGDGIQDLVVVARCKNALIDQDEKGYKVIDPMNSFFGYGNPKVTSEMGQQDPRLKGISLLVIHGAGADAWRAKTPGEKFVVINIDIKSVTVKKMKLRKKSVLAIYVEEATGDQMTAAIFWDGKKYKYEPMGSSSE